MPILDCENLALGYGGKIVSSDICFSVDSGDFLCVMGENGSGKSTLLKVLLKMMPPVSGRIATDDKFWKNGVGYLPQQTIAQKDFPASVREVVRSGFVNNSKMNPFFSKSEKSAAEGNMSKLGIANLANKSFRDLSVGLQQRTLLARALCAAKNILLLDEPTSGLDPDASAAMYGLVAELNSGGMTVIMVSHDSEAVRTRASHILLMGSRSPLFFGKNCDYQTKESERLFSSADSIKYG